jgi:hypothetical protein
MCERFAFAAARRLKEGCRRGAHDSPATIATLSLASALVRRSSRAAACSRSRCNCCWMDLSLLRALSTSRRASRISSASARGHDEVVAAEHEVMHARMLAVWARAPGARSERRVAHLIAAAPFFARAPLQSRCKASARPPCYHHPPALGHLPFFQRRDVVRPPEVLGAISSAFCVRGDNAKSARLCDLSWDYLLRRLGPRCRPVLQRPSFFGLAP